LEHQEKRDIAAKSLIADIQNVWSYTRGWADETYDRIIHYWRLPQEKSNL